MDNLTPYIRMLQIPVTKLKVFSDVTALWLRLVRFRHRNCLVGVKKRLWFGFKVVKRNPRWLSAGIEKQMRFHVSKSDVFLLHPPDLLLWFCNNVTLQASLSWPSTIIIIHTTAIHLLTVSQMTDAVFFLERTENTSFFVSIFFSSFTENSSCGIICTSYTKIWLIALLRSVVME